MPRAGEKGLTLRKTADSSSSKKEGREIVLGRGGARAGESVIAGREARLSRSFSPSRAAEGLS